MDNYSLVFELLRSATFHNLVFNFNKLNFYKLLLTYFVAYFEMGKTLWSYETFRCKFQSYKSTFFFTPCKASQNLKHIKSNAGSSCLLHFIQGLWTMDLNAVDRELPTSTQRSPSSCSPVCRTLPVNRQSMMLVNACVCGAGGAQSGSLPVVGFYRLPYLLPDGDLGLQLVDAVLDGLLTILSMRGWYCHDNTGLTHLDPPDEQNPPF